MFIYLKSKLLHYKTKNNREIELIVQECILTTIRESIPTEDIIRAYMDEYQEQEEEVIIEDIKEDELEKTSDSIETTPKLDSSVNVNDIEEKPSVPSISNIDNEPVVTKLTFNDYDSIHDADTGNINSIEAPKDIERLEQISNERALQRKLEEEESIDDKIQIHTDNLTLADLDILDIDKSKNGNDSLFIR